MERSKIFFTIIFVFLFVDLSQAGIETKDAKELIRIYYSRDSAKNELASFMYCKADRDKKYDCYFLGRKKYYQLSDLKQIVSDLHGKHITAIKSLSDAIGHILTGIGLGVGVTLYILNVDSPAERIAQGIPVGAAVLKFFIPKIAIGLSAKESVIFADLIADDNSIQNKYVIRFFERELNRVLR